ncbi:hypothetical protein [Nocardiopsis ansamitocini]|nr:hypothetical protein [Nocardiopsis ansamitocini]
MLNHTDTAQKVRAADLGLGEDAHDLVSGHGADRLELARGDCAVLRGNTR